MADEQQQAPTSAEADPVEGLTAFFSAQYGEKKGRDDELEPPQRAVADDESDDDGDADAGDVELEATEDTDSDPDEAQEEQADDDYYDLTYNGQQVRVAKGDVQNLAQMGYHYKENQSRFDQQWQQAEQAIGQLRETFNRAPELQAADTQVALFEQALRSYDFGELQRLAADDPAAYVQRKAEIDALQMQYQRAVAQRNGMHQQFGQQIQAAQKQLLAQEYDRAIKTMPAWKDKAKFATDRQAIIDEMKALGATEEEIGSINKAWVMVGMHKAAKWDALQKSKRQTVAAAKTAPKMVKPGAANTAPQNADRLKRAQSQLKKSGRVEDAAVLFEQIFRR